MKFYRSIILDAQSNPVPFVDELTSGNPDYQFSESLPEDFEECDTIVDVINFGLLAFRDFKFVRAHALALAEILTGGDWSTTNFNTVFTTAEKDAICTVFVVMPREAWSAVLFPHLMGQGALPSDVLRVIKKWDKNSQNSRSQRYQEARDYALGTFAEAPVALYELVTIYNFTSLYVEGVEGTIETGGLLGFFDFVDGRVDTIFAQGESTEGLRHRTYTMTGTASNMEEASDGIMDILKEGKYLLDEEYDLIV